VFVPSGADEPADRHPTDVRVIDAGRSFLAAGALAAFEDAVAALREQLDVANARAERAEADRADERLRADGLRAQIDALTATHARDLDAALTRARDATEAAKIATDALNAARRADEARKARGRWARLRAAWRREW
jgi:hypothetical protein